jgi:hypothetical protein
MPRPMSHKVWFTTGASKGFGYVWTEDHRRSAERSAICGNSEPLRFAVSIADLQTNAR